MSRDLALYTSKNDNFLFQNQQWLSWQLQPTQPFPSDAGSFSSLTYNIYHILHHIAAFIVSSSFHTSRAFFHFHFLSKFTSLASFSLSFQIHQPCIFSTFTFLPISQPCIFSTFTFLPNSPASHIFHFHFPSKFTSLAFSNFTLNSFQIPHIPALSTFTPQGLSAGNRDQNDLLNLWNNLFPIPEF